LGFIEGKNRDAIAISADFLMARQDISKVMVYALVKRNRGLSLDVSIRTREKRFNLNAFIKKITQEGGARTFKGGYQVNLDYFVNCPDPDLVWKVVSLTTLETLQRLTVTKKMPFLKQVGRWISKNVRSVTGKNRDG
jgi:nanoRNase/pAp phosphatase (c-di-AMP/oligoRNAs hydrolase)